MKTALTLTYDGSRFHGWQRQKNDITIQETLENAVEKICGVKAYISGCGRTDAGVHAKIYVASLALDTTIPVNRLPMALNSALPPDIRITDAAYVPEDFDARFSCVSKEYTYVLQKGRFPDPFLHNRSYFCKAALDVSAMEDAAQFFCGTHDFKAFQTMGSPRSTTVRTVFYCSVKPAEDLINISICADGFLYNMVRTIAGTMLYCGLHKLEPQDIPGIITSRKRELAGPTLPPGGLYLTALTYEKFSAEI